MSEHTASSLEARVKDAVARVKAAKSKHATPTKKLTVEEAEAIVLTLAENLQHCPVGQLHVLAEQVPAMVRQALADAAE